MKIYDYNGLKNICGKRVRKGRRLRGMTQADLAAKMQLAGVMLDRDSISRIELGVRFVADYELRALAQCLRVPVDFLLEND